MPRIRVAAAQLRASKLADPAAALADIHAAIERAAEQGVELLVLPECAYPAYCLGSAAAYRAAEVMPNDEFIADLASRACRHRMHIVCGFVEELGAGTSPGERQAGSLSYLANSAVVIDDEGRVVGVYRKTFLWGDDNDYFVPGSETRPFETRLGKIGVIICADARAPETVAAHAAQGAEVICMPTCWVNVAQKPGEFYNPQPDFLIATRAGEFELPFVCANKFGRETESIGYCGRSLIVDHTGCKLAEAPPDNETLLVQEISAHPGLQRSSDGRLLARLASREAPSRCIVAGGEIRAAAVPRRFVPSDPDGDEGRALLRMFGEAGVDAAVLTLPVSASAEGWRAAASEGKVRLSLQEDDEIQTADFGRYAILSGKDVNSYVLPRARALDGAAILFVTAAPDDLALLRTRAAENRIFVIASGNEAAAIIAPTGAILARCDSKDPKPAIASVDPRNAADKLVFPKTHVWEQRRPAACQAAFQV